MNPQYQRESHSNANTTTQGNAHITCEGVLPSHHLHLAHRKNLSIAWERDKQKLPIGRTTINICRLSLTYCVPVTTLQPHSQGQNSLLFAVSRAFHLLVGPG